MKIKEELIGAEIVNGKSNSKDEIEYLLLVQGGKVLRLRPKHLNDVIICEVLG